MSNFDYKSILLHNGMKELLNSLGEKQVLELIASGVYCEVNRVLDELNKDHEKNQDDAATYIFMGDYETARQVIDIAQGQQRIIKMLNDAINKITIEMQEYGQMKSSEYKNDVCPCKSCWDIEDCETCHACENCKIYDCKDNMNL